MSEPTTLLLQKAVKRSGGQEIELSFCRDCAFVETVDLSGPRMILKYDDRFSVLRNHLQVVPGDIIDCTLSADAYESGMLNFKAGFRVMSMPVEGDVVTLNMLQEEIACLKDPVKGARLFSKNAYSIEDIIKQTQKAAGISEQLPVDGISMSLLNDYHLLPGDRPSLLLRQLAYEHGALIYAFRGKICFKKLSDLYGGTTNITLSYRKPDADFQVVTYRHLNTDKLVSDKTQRKYFGWSITDGLIEANQSIDAPMEWCQHDSSQIMDNMTVIAMPILDIVTWGTGRLGPGLSVNFQWYLEASWNDSWLDESLPTKAVTGNVTHYTAGAQNYYCRMKAMIPA
ncbi:hypothetical protein [Desulfatirhabdium butyrativorans]|uniref:hypothetical protein n=1 Tax=Desulfatirhabdium butyrativorans TaxID=340467 RepID=UPI00041AF11C|nr:hypothetical protein [Desulfatirhabdium butyrativorans]